MKIWIVIGVILGAIGIIGTLLFLLISSQSAAKPEQSISPVITASATLTATQIPSSTFTPSVTPTATKTPSSTATATLAIRVAAATVIMPNVTLPPTATSSPENLRILAEAPNPLEPLPNATLLPLPYTNFEGWFSFESDHPAMQYMAGRWTPVGSQQASEGQYHFTEDTNAQMRLIFNGEAVRVRYVSFTNGGVWNVLIDGMIVDVIDAYAPVGTFTGTRVYTLTLGEHTLELHNTPTSNPASSGQMLALDAIQVYQPDTLTMIVPGGVLPSPTATATLIPAVDIELIAAPPSPQPTATDIPIQVVNAAVVVGYDENANAVLDVSEGVRGISVRLVEVGSNQELAHGFTDDRGFAHLQASTNAPVQLVVPYFGEAWLVPARAAGTTQTFTLLMSPGNQPGLIP